MAKLQPFLTYQESREATKLLNPTFKTTTSEVIKARIDRCVELGIEKMKLFGLVINDQSETENLIRAAARRLAERYKNIDGRFSVQLDAPFTDVKVKIAACQKKRGDGTDPSYWQPFWVPRTEENSLTEAELNGTPSVSVVFVPFNALKTGFDPILFANRDEALPFDEDERSIDGYTDTQTAFSARVCGEYGYAPGNHINFSWMWLDDWIGEVDYKGPDFILNNGWGYLVEFGRRLVGGESVVGVVFSHVGRPWFGGGDGCAGSNVGVFFSAEEKIRP